MPLDCLLGVVNASVSVCIAKQNGQAVVRCQYGVCRKSGTIVLAYIASTLLVIGWLIFTIEITLQENEEDASGAANPGRTAELIKASWLIL